jgi:hypothetical protein
MVAILVSGQGIEIECEGFVGQATAKGRRCHVDLKLLGSRVATIDPSDYLHSKEGEVR